MRAVVTQGTARRAQFGDFEIAGKTGTSQDYRDAWFIGYTAQYIAGVWVGNDDNSPTKKVTGGSIPAAVWKDVMVIAHRDASPAPLPGDMDSEPPTMETEPQVAFQPEPGQSGRRADAFDEDDGFFQSLGSLFGSDRGERRANRNNNDRHRASTKNPDR
jgi:penicillin-binding protein 1A